jgi:Tfp pilus assembly protein PilN
MPLGSCPACQNPVSDEATSCPKCGQPLRTSRRSPAMLLGLLILLAAAVAGGIWWQSGVTHRRARIEFLTAQMERCFQLRHLKMLAELGPGVRVRTAAETKQLTDCDAFERELRELEMP